MTAPFWLPPLIKALTTALLVVGASVIAESVGPFWAALVASLPVSAGPAYVFLAIQHDIDFVAAAALSSFAANAAIAVMLTSYAVLAPRTPPWRCLFIAVSLWAVSSVAIQMLSWTPLTATLLNLALYGGGCIILRNLPPSIATPSAAKPRRRLDLLARALAVASFVTLLVALSATIGARATGMMAVFPVSLISLIVIIRPRIGGTGAALLTANALRPMLGFGLALLTLHLTIQAWGNTAALLTALAVSAGWSVLLLLWARRKSWKCG